MASFNKRKRASVRECNPGRLHLRYIDTFSLPPEAGSFIQTLTMVDVATGWTECLPLLNRDGILVVEALKRAQSLFPWLLRGVDFDNDSAFMNEVVVPWCRGQKLEVTRSRAYKKNDQAFVEQKNGAVVRRLMEYGRFDGAETARVMARLYASARLYVNFFQP